MSKETILAVMFVVVMIAGAVYVTQYMDPVVPDEEDNPSEEEPSNGNEEGDSSMKEFVQCLKDANVLIYGSQTCPYCAELVESLGGSNIVKPIYFDCSGLGSEEDTDRCVEEMQTGYVPEIQIDGEVYQGQRDPQTLAERVGCEI